MQFTKLFDDDRAVSPVIGVILMVAITVILAAVIGTFVLGLSDQVDNTTPRASFGFDTENSKTDVVITHESGDTINADDVVIKSTQNFDYTDGGGDNVASAPWSTIDTSTSEVDAGTSLTIHGNGGASFADETVRVVYDNPDSDSTSTLQKFEVPN